MIYRNMLAEQGLLKESDSEYEKKVHDNMALIKKAANFASKKAYKNLAKQDEPYGSSKSWVTSFKEVNRTAPTVDEIDNSGSDYYSIYMKFAKDTNPDYILFYQDTILPYLNADESVNKLFKFTTEDYPGIIVM